MRGSMKTRNRFASVLLSGVLAFSLCPISAYTVEASDGPDRDNASRLEQTPPPIRSFSGRFRRGIRLDRAYALGAVCTITINGGTVNASGGGYDAGIGNGDGSGGPYAAVTITGSKLDAAPSDAGTYWVQVEPRPRNCTHPPKCRRGGARRHDRRHGTGAAAVAALGCAALAGAAMTAAIRARRRIR